MEGVALHTGSTDKGRTRVCTGESRDRFRLRVMPVKVRVMGRVCPVRQGIFRKDLQCMEGIRWLALVLPRCLVDIQSLARVLLPCIALQQGTWLGTPVSR